MFLKYIIVKLLIYFRIFSMTSGNKKEGTSSYNPAKTKYHPIDDACWKQKEK